MGFFKNLRTVATNLDKIQLEAAFRGEMYFRSLYNSGTSALTYQNLKQLIEKGYQTNVDVFSVINWIVEQAAQIPVRVQVMKNGEWVFDDTHEVQQLINQPNQYQDGTEFRAQAFTFYLATGNTFIYAPKIEGGNNNGKAKEMYIMPSQSTTIKTGSWMQPIKGYELSVSANEVKEMPFSDVIHLRTVNLDYGNGRELYGMSPLRAGLLALDRSNANYTASSQTFKNTGLGGILSEKKSDFAGALTDEQRQKEEKRIAEDYYGVFNKGKTMVTNADVTYTPIGLSPVDMNLIADKNATLRDFCNIYNVSSILFNDNENSSYNNMLEAKKSGLNEACLPLVYRFIDKVTMKLLQPYGKDIRLIADISDIPVLQKDKKEQAEWVTSLVDRGIISRGEALELLDIKGSDSPEMFINTVSLNTIPLSEIGIDPMAISQEEAQKFLKKYNIE